MAEPQLRIVCAGCDRELEVCSFCEDEDCEAPTCYRCMIIELKEASPPLHGHGG
jgi:hypothetical protein